MTVQQIIDVCEVNCKIKIIDLETGKILYEGLGFDVKNCANVSIACVNSDGPNSIIIYI